MIEKQEDPETVWGNLLSRDANLIRTEFSKLSQTSQGIVLGHLKRMVQEAGWHEEQVNSAKIALEVLAEQPGESSEKYGLVVKPDIRRNYNETEVAGEMPKIAVFGGSQLMPGDDAYEKAYELGKQLGNIGYTVLTGGYIGSMEAVSRGAAEAGTHVIGVTCEDIEAWRPVGANCWVKEEIRMRTIPERILCLIENSDGALALPGGVGTLTEVMMTWNLLLTDSIRPRPLVLIGKEWHDFIHYYLHAFGAYIPAKQRDWISTAEDTDAAVVQLQEILTSGKV